VAEKPEEYAGNVQGFDTRCIKKGLIDVSYISRGNNDFERAGSMK